MSPCATNRKTEIASKTIQYSQFSSFTCAVSQVASRLPQVVSESRNGHAACVPVERKRDVSTLSAIMATHEIKCARRGHVVTGWPAPSSRDQCQKPYTAMPT